MHVPSILLHHLETIVKILPYHIEGGYDAAQRIEVALGHPDGKHRVFLAKRLPARHVVAIPFPDTMAHKKLEKAQKDRDDDHPKKHRPMFLELGQKQPDGPRDDHCEGDRPNIKRKVFMPVDIIAGLRQEPTGEHRQHKGRDKQRKHLAENGEEGTPKGDVGPGPDERERKRSNHRHHQIAGDEIRAHHADIGPQDQRHCYGGRGCRSQHCDKSTLGDDRIHRKQQKEHRGGDCQLEQQQPKIEHRETHLPDIQ